MTLLKILFFRVTELHFFAKTCNLQPCKKCTFTLSHQFYPRQIPGKSGKSTSSRCVFKNLPSAGRQKILNISIKYWPKILPMGKLWKNRPVRDRILVCGSAFYTKFEFYVKYRPEITAFFGHNGKKHYCNGTVPYVKILSQDFSFSFDARRVCKSRALKNNTVKKNVLINYDPRQLPGLPGVKSAPAYKNKIHLKPVFRKNDNCPIWNFARSLWELRNNQEHKCRLS